MVDMTSAVQPHYMISQTKVLGDGVALWESVKS